MAKKITLTDELRGVVKGNTIEAEAVSEHYCVHRNMDSDMTATTKWTITHTPTGYAVIRFRTKAEACTIAKLFEEKAPTDDQEDVTRILRPMWPTWKDYLTSRNFEALSNAILTLKPLEK